MDQFPGRVNDCWLDDHTSPPSKNLCQALGTLRQVLCHVSSSDWRNFPVTDFGGDINEHYELQILKADER